MFPAPNPPASLDTIQVRSPELESWICGKSHEELELGVPSLSRAMRRELFAEAMRDDRVRAVYERMPEAIRETAAIKKYCTMPEIYGFVPLELPGMNEGNVPSSNILATSAIFTVRKNRLSTRRFFQSEPIVSRSTTYIEYTGEELYQTDWDVLHALICLSKDAFNVVHRIRPGELLSLLGLTDSGDNYDLLADSLVRLSKASIYIENRSEGGANVMTLGGSSRVHNAKQKELMVLHFVERLHWIRGNTLMFAMDQRLVRLFGNHEYGLIYWEQRQLIRHNELAKKLQCLFSGQKANQQFHSVKKLLAITGLTCDTAQFTRLLSKALNELIKAKIIVAYWISKPKRGEAAEKKVLCIWKEEGPTPSQPIPKSRGKFCDSVLGTALAKLHKERAKWNAETVVPAS